MKIWYSLPLIVTSLMVFGELTVAEELLYAVYPIEGLENLFSEIKYRESGSHCQVEEAPTVTDDVCKAIVQSIYIFKNYNVKPLTAGWNHSEISSKNCSVENSSLYMTGSYKRREVLIFKNMSTRMLVFPCLASNYWNGELVEFHISREYKLDDDRRSARIRFIFKQNTQGRLTAIGSAERPPQVSTFLLNATRWTKYYEVRDALRQAVGEANHREICDLSVAMKYRLCAVILNAEHYQKRVTFPGIFGNSNELLCDKLRMVVQYTDSQDDSLLGLDEYVVHCDGTRMEVGIGTVRVTYFVSKGIESGQYFIYKAGPKHHVLVDHCYL